MIPSGRPDRATRRLPNPRHTLSRLEAEWRSLATRRDSLAVAATWTFLGLDPDRLRSLDDVLVATGFRLAPPRRAAGHAATSGPVQPPSATAVAPDPAAPGGTETTAGAANAADAATSADPEAPDRHGSAGPHDRADAALLGLVTAARTDDLAARVVLQRILPGLSAIARRHGQCLDDHLRALDDLLAAAWLVIRSFPVERRRRHLAASLLRDCEYHAFRREHRRLLVHDYSQGDHLDALAGDDARAEPMLELLEVIDAARERHLVAGDLELLRLLLGGRLVRDVAQELSISERTLRNRRDAAVQRLRAAIAA